MIISTSRKRPHQLYTPESSASDRSKRQKLAPPKGSSGVKAWLDDVALSERAAPTSLPCAVGHHSSRLDYPVQDRGLHRNYPNPSTPPSSAIQYYDPDFGEKVIEQWQEHQKRKERAEWQEHMRQVIEGDSSDGSDVSTADAGAERAVRRHLQRQLREERAARRLVSINTPHAVRTQVTSSEAEDSKSEP